MKVVRHYACLTSEELCDFLDRNKVSFQQDCSTVGMGRVYFDVFESDCFFPELAKIELKDCVITKQVRYSKKEIESAQWLTCNPTTAKVNLTNQDKTFWVSEQYGTGKAYHRMLSGMPFYISKRVAHNGKQHFFASYDAPNQLFCTEYAKSMLQRINLPISFEPVLNSKTEMPIGDLYALHIQYVLPVKALDLSNSEETFACPVCGSQTFLPPFSLQIRKEYLIDTPGIFRTEAVFGWGGNYSAPINIISNEIYLELVEKRLVRGLEIEPISLI